MQNRVRKYFNIFQTMEINQSTDDVKADVKHLNFGTKAKFFSYYAIVAIAGLAIYQSGVSSIKEDTFKKQLIEKANYSPASAYLANSYSDELAAAEEKYNLLYSELSKLDNLKGGMNRFSYTSKTFYQDVKIDTDLKEKVDKLIMESSSYDEYMQYYFKSYLANNSELKIKLGDNEYSYFQISKKIATLKESEAIEKLQIPAKAILETLNLSQSDKLIKTLSIAIHSISQSNLFEMYKNTKVSPDALKSIREGMAKGSRYISYKSRYLNERVSIPNLKTLYLATLKAKKKAYNLEKVEFDKNLAENKLKIAKLDQETKTLSVLIRQIKNLRADAKNYPTNKEIVENTLSKVEL